MLKRGQRSFITEEPGGPRQTVPGGTCYLPSSAVAEVQSQGKRMYVGGVATYQDAFGANHETRFCWEIINPIEQGATLNFAYTTCVRGNCADRECEKEDSE
jgi:hypothetical protein